MKLFAISATALAAVFILTARSEAAPSILGGNSAVVVIASGSGRLAGIGGYRITFSDSSTGFAISPIGGAGSPSTGTYVYAKTGGSRARLTLTDAGQGIVIVQNLDFSTASSATFSVSTESGSQSGVFVLEKPPTESGIANLSMRAHVPLGSQIIQGIVVDRPTRVLIRVAGPALTSFGVNDPLPNPRVSLMLGSLQLATNDDWSNTISNYDAVRDAGAKSGAFPFNFGSRDAAMVLDLVAGAYTCIASGAPGTSGEVLVEFYRVPE